MSDAGKRRMRDAFKARLVEKANSLIPKISIGDMAVVEREVAENSLVYAVWQDREVADGVGCLLIKGEAVLKVVVGMEPDFTLDMKCTAIPCNCAEQAHALRNIYGDGTIN